MTHEELTAIDTENEESLRNKELHKAIPPQELPIPGYAPDANTVRCSNLVSLLTPLIPLHFVYFSRYLRTLAVSTVAMENGGMLSTEFLTSQKHLLASALNRTKLLRATSRMQRRYWSILRERIHPASQ